jgi:hypothetical protein
MSEHIFTDQDMPRLAPPFTQSRLYIVSEHAEQTPLMYAGETADGIPIEQLPVDGDELERRALRIAFYYQVETITIADGGTLALNGLAVAFGQHLRKNRTAQGSSLRSPFITSGQTPTPPANHVRLPHMVARQTGPDTVGDTTIWELLHADSAERWLGKPLPDQATIEPHIATIAALRRAARDGQLTHTAAEQHLAALLAEQKRYISILFVYQNLGLFRDLFAERAETPSAP